jgi:beta-glucosidase
LPKSADESFKRLVGWKRVRLAPGESQTVTVAIDPQVLQTFDDTTGRWKFAPGDYEIVVGASSDNTPLRGSLSVH